MHNGFRINCCGDRTTNKNFRHNIHNSVIVRLDQTVLGDCRVGEVVNFGAGTAHTSKGIARLARVGGGTARVDVLTKAVGRFLAAGHVGLTRIVRNKTAVLDEFVHARMVATMAASGLAPAV